MNELDYLHISWMINVILAFLCGIVYGSFLNYKNDKKWKQKLN